MLPAVVLCLGACASGVDLSGGLVSVQLDDENCGSLYTSCAHLGRQTVDFTASTLTREACVEGVDGGSPLFGPTRGDSVSTRPLTAVELTQVRQAVEGLRVATERIEMFDGPMSSVTVVTGHLTQTMSPGAACGQSPYQRIVDGYATLERVVSGL